MTAAPVFVVALAFATALASAEPPPPPAMVCRVVRGAWVQTVDAHGRTVLTRPVTKVCAPSRGRR